MVIIEAFQQPYQTENKMKKFKKDIVKIICVIIPLTIIYFWIPVSLREAAPIFFMATTIVAYQLGSFIAKVILDERIN